MSDSPALPDGGPDSGGGPDTSTGDTGTTDTGTMDTGADGGCALPDAAPGSLDLSFTSGVKSITGFEPLGATIDPGGNVYVAGRAQNCPNNRQLALVKLNQDGTQDKTFGGSANPRCVQLDMTNNAYGVGFAAAWGPSSTVIVGGAAGHVTPTQGFGAVLSLNAMGNLDSNFGAGGIKVMGPSAPDASAATDAGPFGPVSAGFTSVNGVAASSSKIAIVGSNSIHTNSLYEAAGSTGFIVLLNKDGSVDPNFNSGKPVIDANVGGFWGVAFDAMGRLLVVGQTNATQGNQKLAVRRISADGKTVEFSTDVPATGGYLGRAILPLPGGAIVAAGPSKLVGQSFAGTITVVQLKSDGSVDPGFNGGSPVVTNLSSDGFLQSTSLATLCTGAVLATGFYTEPDGGVQDLALVRFKANGTIDNTFGTNGLALEQLGSSAVPVGAAQDPVSGKVVVIGRNIQALLVAARFNP